MKLKRLKLKAFGFFSDFEIDFGEGARFVLIYGLNEAGKSTLLRAIKDFFYGIPQRSPDAYFHPSKKLCLEASLRGSDGREFHLTRRKGLKNTLLDEEGRALDDRFLQEFLGSIEREQFSTMFGMDHYSLRKGGKDLLEGRGALGEALFEAAAGIGGLRELFGELEKEAGELFKPSGKNPPLNARIHRYGELKRKIHELSLRPASWAELEGRYLEEKREVERLRKELKELRETRSRLERQSRALPLLARRKQYLQEIASLGDVPPLPPSFSTERQELVKKRDAADVARRRAQQDAGNLQARKEKIEVPQELLEHAEDISLLQEGLETYRSSRDDIPLLEGEIKELEEGAYSLLRQLNPSLASLEEAEALRLPFPQVEEVKRLAGRRPLLEQAHENARQRVEEAEFSLKKQKEKAQSLGPRKNIGRVSRALKSAGKKGELEESQQRLCAEAAQLEKELQDSLKSLGLWTGSLEELQCIPLPLLETVRAFQDEEKELGERIKRTREKTTEEEQKRKDCLKQLADSELSGEVPTEERLYQAREHRQFGWHLVRRAWLEGHRSEKQERTFGGDKPLEIAFETSIARADELADRLRFEADRVQRKALNQAEAENSREKIEELQEEMSALEHQKADLHQRWSSLWEKTGIEPLSPAEMGGWLERCGEILEKKRDLDRRRGEEMGLLQAIEEHRRELDQALRELDEPGATEEETLESLKERAQGVYEKLQGLETQRSSIASACEELEEKLSRARKEESHAAQALQQWGREWAGALQKASLHEETGPEAALGYLEKLEELFTKKEEIARQRAVLQRLKKNKAEFETRVETLVSRLAPDLSGLSADQAASQLRARTARVQQEQAALDELEEALQKAHKARKEAEEELQAAQNGLNQLMSRARCSEETELEAVETKARRLKELQQYVEELEGQLLSIGAGLTLEDLVEEARAIDGDSLPAELGEVEQQLQHREQELEALNQQFGATKREYEEKKEGTSVEALETAEEAQGVLAEIRQGTEQYLRLRLASAVLRRGIERYREEHQSPIIKRAGELFARLTRGSFEGLQIDFDEKDNPVLAGVRSSVDRADRVTVEGMSDGTLDQLYLALRLASLEQYMERHEPLPFILDDLLVNFDDERAVETLRVLTGMAEQTQILFFTHHRSLLEMAQNVVPPETLQVCELQ